MKVSFDPAFKRALRRRIVPDKNLEKRFREILSIFVRDPFDPRLKTHKLSGNLEGLFSFRVNYEIRVIFYFAGHDQAVLLDIGAHDDVY